MICNNLANFLSDSTQRARREAEKLYREALKLYRNLSATNPSVYEPDVAMTCNNLAILLAASPEGRKKRRRSCTGSPWAAAEAVSDQPECV